jgi:hypothetical protein
MIDLFPGAVPVGWVFVYFFQLFYLSWKFENHHPPISCLHGRNNIMCISMLLCWLSVSSKNGNKCYRFRDLLVTQFVLIFHIDSLKMALD